MRKIRVIVAHTNKNYMEKLKNWLKRNLFVGVVETVNTLDGVKELCKKGREKVDIVFLYENIDAGLCDEDAEKLRENNKRMVIFLMKDTEEAVSMALTKACDFSIPVIRNTMEVNDNILRALISNDKKLGNEVVIRTFGCFGVICKGKVLHFSNKKARELLALCVDRVGAELPMEMVIEELWPEKPYGESVKRLYRRAVSDLQKILNDAAGKEVFVASKGYCYLEPSLVISDFFSFLAACIDGNTEEEVIKYYMPEYAWAEGTIAELYFFACRGRKGFTEF